MQPKQVENKMGFGINVMILLYLRFKQMVTNLKTHLTLFFYINKFERVDMNK